MKTTKLLSLAITALVALASTTWAGPYGGGGGGQFGGGGFSGGHGGGGFRGGQFGGFGGGHFGSAGIASFNGGGIRAAPTFSAGGAPRNVSGLSRTPQQFSYYSGARTSAVMPRVSNRQLPNRSMSLATGRAASVNRQSNRVNSAVGQKRLMNPRLSTAENRQSFVKNHAFARHDGNWHGDWEKHHAHFDHGRVFVFVNGFWWGLYPWDYYPYYGYGYGDYPYDYSYDYPYDYSGYPHDGADYSPPETYGYYNGYAPSGQYSNRGVSAVQSKLASLGYYHGAIDGVLGDESQAALARYQQDQDLSVTGTVTSATLQALDLPYSGL